MFRSAPQITTTNCYSMIRYVPQSSLQTATVCLGCPPNHHYKLQLLRHCCPCPSAQCYVRQLQLQKLLKAEGTGGKVSITLESHSLRDLMLINCTSLLGPYITASCSQRAINTMSLPRSHLRYLKHTTHAQFTSLR